MTRGWLRTSLLRAWLRAFPARPVVWGGRAIDRWIGSPADLRLAELERIAAKHRHRQTAALAALARMGHALDKVLHAQHEAARRFAADLERVRPIIRANIGANVSEAVERINASARALERAGITQDAARTRAGLPPLERAPGRRGR
jgi:hypothetical protein